MCNVAGKRSDKSAKIWAYILKAPAKLSKSAINVYNDICTDYGNNELFYATFSR
jgi:hypothetical protein